MSMRRRDVFAFAIAGTVVAATGAQAEPTSCSADGTPLQFVPKKRPDPRPAEDDLGKYPACPYCGMDRRQHHHSRMLVHYGDDLPDPTCSLHCAAVSLAINIDRGPKAIYVADNGASADIKPLVEASSATFLVGSSLRGVMTRRSKVAYGSEAAAQAARSTSGGELMDFDRVLLAAYLDMAEDVAAIRRNREERRKRMQEQRHG
jgi:copper chaperone NosL